MTADLDTTTITAPEGLTDDAVKARRDAGEGNNVQVRAGRSTWDIIRANVFTRINAMLGVLFIIVISTGSIINAAFGLLIIANSGIGIIQELRAKRMLEKLSIVGQAKPEVRRNGQDQEIAPSELVKGDLILLKPGDQIVVDGEVRTAKALSVDESLLTGESDPIVKEPGDVVMSGSFVVAGSGTYQATKVGKDAYAAQLASEASEFSLTNSQLMTGINKILRVITWLLIPTGIATIYMQLFQTKEPLKESILAMAAALVPMVPEGLVLMTSIAFAVGVVRLGQKQCLVQELPAIEGLARVDVVCTDKTGTLTDNSMTFAELVLLGESESANSDVADSQPAQALRAMAQWDDAPNDSMQAILEWARGDKAPDEESTTSHEEISPWEQTADVPFSSAKKWSAMAFGDNGDWVLGAPDVLAPAGSDAAAKAEEIGSQGLRVLMLAQSSAPIESLEKTGAQQFVADGTVTPCALVVLQQSIRPDAAETLEYFQNERVDVKVISGDNARSVGAVAEELNMEGADAPYDARELPPVGDDFDDVISAHTVFGRVTPEQKRNMVDALHHNNHTVAMTGDGVNDVLALKRADIGVAMGSGSAAARSVAQIVLLDNRFATLPSVVGEGRRVIGNIERVANLFLTKTVYSVLLAILVVFIQAPFPFQPIHVTITGWFTIGIPAFLLSLAPNKDRARDGFVNRVLRLAVPSGVIIAMVAFGTYIGLAYTEGLKLGLIHNSSAPALTAAQSATLQTQVSTATLAALIITATWVLCVVARPLAWWKVLLVALSASMYPVLFWWPFTAKLFYLDATNLTLMGWGAIAGLVGAVLVEILWWVMGAVRGEKRFVWQRTRDRVEEAQRQERLAEAARLRAQAQR